MGYRRKLYCRQVVCKIGKKHRAPEQALAYPGALTLSAAAAAATVAAGIVAVVAAAAAAEEDNDDKNDNPGTVVTTHR